jgi:hypothetical protein
MNKQQKSIACDTVSVLQKEAFAASGRVCSSTVPQHTVLLWTCLFYSSLCYPLARLCVCSTLACTVPRAVLWIRIRSQQPVLLHLDVCVYKSMCWTIHTCQWTRACLSCLSTRRFWFAPGSVCFSRACTEYVCFFLQELWAAPGYISLRETVLTCTMYMCFYAQMDLSVYKSLCCTCMQC